LKLPETTNELIEKLTKTISASKGINPYPVKIEFQPGIDHVSHKADMWTMSMFKEGDVSFRDNHILDDMEKLQLDIANDLINGKNTAPRPEQMAVEFNVITSIGLTESAKRDTNEVSTFLSHSSIGTTSTAATESDTDLAAEDSGGSYARQAFTAATGQAKVATQTAKYGMLWNDTLISAAPLIINEAGIHWHLSDASKIHARVTFTDFNLTTGNLFVTQMNELHQNG
jgi:hypothetical protein